MGKTIERIDSELRAWLAVQRMFFVATAPLAGDGHVNCSPKGGDSFRVVGEHEVLYQDLTGSGCETAAHVRENGRIVIMFCAFEGPPRILRMHGRGEIVLEGHPRYEEFSKLFSPHLGRRAFVRVHVDRIANSCGYGVPRMEFVEHRSALDDWAERKGKEDVDAYRRENNRLSLDDLPAFDD